MVAIDETKALLFAFVIMLVPFPLTSIGTTQGIPTLWWIGIALLIIGGVIPPLARYLLPDDEDEEDDDTENGGGPTETGEESANGENADTEERREHDRSDGEDGAG